MLFLSDSQIMSNNSNPQRSKARAALIASFNELVLVKPYADFHISDIIKRADVSRSTFYEHFRSKDDILKLCLTDVLGPLARAGIQEGSHEHLTMILEHFVEFEQQTRVYLSGPASVVVIDRLAELIEPLLPKEQRESGSVSVGLLAMQIACSTIGLISSWLQQESREPASRIAAHLERTAGALIQC